MGGDVTEGGIHIGMGFSLGDGGGMGFVPGGGGGGAILLGPPPTAPAFPETTATLIHRFEPSVLDYGNGNDVTIIEDISASGNDMERHPSSTKYGTQEDDAINGLSAVRFQEGTMYRAGASYVLDADDGDWWMLAAHADWGETQTTQWIQWWYSNNVCGLVAKSNTPEFVHDDSNEVTLPNLTEGQFYLFRISKADGDSRIRYYLDTTEQASNFTADNFKWGHLGHHSTFKGPDNGLLLAGQWVWDGQLSSGEESDMVDYINTLYGTSF